MEFEEDIQIIKTARKMGIGFFMEWQAVRSMEALQKISEAHATVLRNGEPRTVQAHELVPGDILLLESGNVVPADATGFFF